MKPPECASVRERMSDFLEGELEGPEGREVRLHLQRCAPCRAALQGLGASMKALSEAERPKPSPGFRSAVLGRSRSAYFRWAVLAACVALALVALRRQAPEAARPSAPLQPRPSVAFSSFTGSAERLPAGAPRWVPLSGGISQGDLLRTGKEGARLVVGGHPLPLPPDAVVLVERAEGSALRLAYYGRRAELDQTGSEQVLKLLDAPVSLVRRDGSVGLVTSGSTEEGWASLERVGFAQPKSEPRPAPAKVKGDL